MFGNAERHSVLLGSYIYLRFPRASSPTPSVGMKWKRVDCGSYHCCALDVRGHASCWQMADNEGGMSGQTVVPSDVISWKDVMLGFKDVWGNICAASCG